MKHALLLMGIVFCFHFTLAQKQVITDFESWETLAGWPGVEEPEGWTTLNPYTAPLGIVSVSKSTASFQGNYSIQLAPLRSLTLSKQKITFILNGAAKIDSLNHTYDTLAWGVNKPILGFSKIFGYYKFIPDTNYDESAYLIVLLRKGLTSMSGKITLQKSSAFHLFECNPEGFPGFVHDTLSIGIFYSTNDTSAIPKGRLWIDFISTFNPNSTQELHQSFIHLYPNPNHTGKLHIKYPQGYDVSQSCTITFWSALGQQIKRFTGTAEELMFLNIQGLSQGCYIVEVKTAEGPGFRQRLLYNLIH